MNRWGNRNLEETSPKFKLIFENHSTAIDMLRLPNFPEDAKNNSTEFTQILLIPKNRHVLHQLLQIAINPQCFSQKHNCKVDNKLTHAAIEILTNLSEDFIDAVFEQERTKEDEVVQTEKDYPILTSIFKIAAEGQLETTALAYFSKIVTPFVYQKPAEMLSFLSEQAMPLIVRYFWSSEMSELVGKVLQAQTEKSFFQDQKVIFAKKVVRQIELFQDSSTIEETIESLSDFMANLVDKHEDKYDRGKYSKLLKRIIEDSQKYQFLLSHLQKYKENRVIRAELLHCIESYLKIHLPASSLKNQEQQPQIQPILLNPKYAKLLQQYFSNHQVNDFVSDIRLQLVNYYKVIKLLLSVSPKSTQTLITRQFLSDTVKIMKKEQNNNILHNLQRQIVTKAVTESPAIHNIVQNQINLLQQLRSTITQKNSRSSYANQIFLISQALRAKSKTQHSQLQDLETALGNKRKFYSMPIANLKNRNEEDKWDNLQTELMKPEIIKPELKIENPTKPKILKPKNANNQPFTMVSRLDQMEGTEVLSEEEDGFPNQESTKNNHYYDDLGMPELPLDSDKSEEGELKGDSLENLPQNLRENSGVVIPIQDTPQTLIQKPNQQLSNSQDDFDIPETLGTDSIKFKPKSNTQEDQLPDTLGQNSYKKIALEDKAANLQLQINGLVPQVEAFQMKNVSMISQPDLELINQIKQEVSGFNELTVSINIAEESSNVSEVVVCRQEIECLLLGKYGLELAIKKQ